MTQGYRPGSAPGNNSTWPALVLIGMTILILGVLLAGSDLSQPTDDDAQAAQTDTSAADSAPGDTAAEVESTPVPAEAEASPPPTEEDTAVTQAEPTEAQPVEAVTVAAAHYDPAQVEEGQRIYMANCFACHGMDARGIPGLGKDLIVSEFMDGLTDEELVNFVIAGRQPWEEGNTTGVSMPPRGGNPMVTNDQIMAVVAYLRTASAEFDAAQTGQPVQETPAEVVQTEPTATPTPRPTQPPSTPAPTPDAPFEVAYAPDFAYAWSCSGCHGADGRGVEGFASASLFDSDLLDAANRADLLAFLTIAQPPVNPEEAFPHPARGGYPILTDEQLEELIDYLYTLAP